MFTGIVKGAYTITAIHEEPGLRRFELEFDAEMVSGLEIGASVALDGVCMTVTRIDGHAVYFDAMQETLDTTTLGLVKPNDLVNAERSFRKDAEVGGHILSGHIDGMAEVVDVELASNKRVVSYRLPNELCKYVFKKGFVAIDGCSLTVVDTEASKGLFRVSYIPETLRVTTHANHGVGDKVNIEIDRQTQVIVDTVERVLAERGELA